MALTDDLVSFWELEEASGTRNDSHGTNDLNDNNSVGQGSGKVGNCADFESGSSNYLSHADNADLSTGDGVDFTICAWVNLESKPAEGGIVSKASQVATEYILEYVGVSGFFCFAFFVGTNALVKALSFGDPSIGTWCFVVAWHDVVDGSYNIQVNDGAVDSTPDTSFADSALDFQIGRYGTSQYFDGLIDQVGFWKRVLTTQERTDLYNGGAGLSYAALSGGGGTTFTQSLSATLASIAALMKQATALKAGTLTSAAAAVKRTSTATTGTVTTTGEALKQSHVSASGSVVSAGTIVKQGQKVAAGTLSSSAVLSAIKTVLLALTATVTSAAALVRQTMLTRSGTMTTTGEALKQPQVSTSGSVSTAATSTKHTSRAFAGSVTPSATLVGIKTVLLSIAGTLTAAAALVRQTNLTRSGVVTTAGEALKQSRVSTSGSLASGAAATKRTSKAFAGSTTPSASLVGVRIVMATLSATLTLIGDLVSVLIAFTGARIDLCRARVVALMPKRSAQSLAPDRRAQSLTPKRDTKEIC